VTGQLIRENAATTTRVSERRHVRHRRKRILHVIQNLNYGGMERVLADVVRGVDKSRFEMHVMALEYLGRFADGLEKVAHLHLAGPQQRWSMVWPRGLAREIARIAPDVVHTHSGVWYKASLAARLAGVNRVIHTEHGRREPDPFSDRVVDSFAVRRTDVVAAVSERLRIHLVAKGIAPAHKVEVVPNGIDTAVYAPHRRDGQLHRALGLAADVAVIGSIGRLEPIKGYDIMIEAFALLCAEWPNETKPILVIGGEGSERQRLEQLVRARGLESRVHLLGWRDDIVTLHAGFSLFTMSSRSEGTSISLLEAMSASLCPIVTDVGGNRAVLGTELAHRLVPPDDPAALASAWRAALCDARRSDDAARARARVENQFGLRAMVARYEQLYATTVRESPCQ
jgi:glycosyltransferase involved in cell wall biosynthesis